MLEEKCSISKPHSCSHLRTQQNLLSISYIGSWLHTEATVNSLPPGSVGVGTWSNADFLIADTGKVYVWVYQLLPYWNTSHLLGNMFWWNPPPKYLLDSLVPWLILREWCYDHLTIQLKPCNSWVGVCTCWPVTVTGNSFNIVTVPLAHRSTSWTSNTLRVVCRLGPHYKMSCLRKDRNRHAEAAFRNVHSNLID